MKKKLCINFVAVLTHHNDDITCIPLFCREYHANKLAYVLSRSVSRSCFKKAEVIGFDDFCKNEDLAKRFLRVVWNNLLSVCED